VNFCPETLITTLYYIKKFQRLRPSFPLNILTINRVFLASFTVAIKFVEDRPIKNSFLATIGGVPKAELNRLEWSFLQMLNFDLCLSEEEYQNFYLACRIRQSSFRQQLVFCTTIFSVQLFLFFLTLFFCFFLDVL
jgi:hypothetical protein